MPLTAEVIEFEEATCAHALMLMVCDAFHLGFSPVLAQV
jgi:hypothetical protein